MCSQKTMCEPRGIVSKTHIQIKLSPNFIKIVNHLGDNTKMCGARQLNNKINNNKMQHKIRFNNELSSSKQHILYKI